MICIEVCIYKLPIRITYICINIWILVDIAKWMSKYIYICIHICFESVFLARGMLEMCESESLECHFSIYYPLPLHRSLISISPSSLCRRKALSYQASTVATPTAPGWWCRKSRAYRIPTGIAWSASRSPRMRRWWSRRTLPAEP